MRQDGRISILFLNDVEAAGKTPTALSAELENGLKPFVLNPRVNVVVDEPQGIPNTIPSVWEVTNPELAVVRLHGRNHGTWNRKGLTASSQRFDYDYHEDELATIAQDVTRLARDAATTHVLFNNNYEDQGQRGAGAVTGILRSTG